jgi:hypothetical protein
VEVVAFGSEAEVLTRQGVPQGSIEVARAFDNGLQAQILVAQLLHRAVGIRIFSFKAGWHSQKSGLEVCHLPRVDAPQVQTNTSLLLDGFSVLKEMFVACRQDADHAQVRRLEPRAQAHGNVVSLFGNVISQDDIFHPQLGTHATDVTTAQIGHQAPIEGVGDGLELKLFNDQVQAIAAVARGTSWTP